jgi:hypothetical protein
MTQSTLRFLIAGIFTVGLLASLARGDDKPRAPELLPMPHCDACDKAPDCCTAGAPCCQEGSDCCAKSTIKKIGFLVGEMPQGVDFSKSWSSSTVKGADIKVLIADLMNEYHAFYKEHKYQEAEICAIKAQELDPDNYVVGAAVQTAHMAKAHQEYRDIGKEQRGLYSRQEIHEVERVGPLNQSVRSAKTELDTCKKLDGQITGFDYRDVQLQQILDDLAGWSQIDIVPDPPTLKAANINLSQPVTLKLDGVNLRTALSRVLEPAGLTYQVKNDALVITTKEKALTLLERKVFPVPDLVGPDSNSLTSFLSLLTENKQESPEAALIQFIQNTVEPQSWSKSGGLATIEFFPLGKAMVVSQTPENQEKVQKLLNALRLLQGPKVADAKCASCLVIGCDVPAGAAASQTPSQCETRTYTVPTSQLVTEFAAPQLSNHEPAAQALPFITREANGTTRMGFTYGSFATEASPLPPPVPTFRVPPTVDGEMWTRGAATSVQDLQHAVRTELGTCTAGQACQEPQSCDSPLHAPALQCANPAFSQACQQPKSGEFFFRVGVCGMDLCRPDGPHPASWTWAKPSLTPPPQAVSDLLMKWTAETLQAIAPACPSPIPGNPTFGQTCVPVHAEASRDCAISAGTGLRFFVPQLGPVPVSLDFDLPRVNWTSSDQPQPNASVRDYRVSVGSGMRMMVPGLGPVPVTFDLRVPVAQGTPSTQACSVVAVQASGYPVPVPLNVPPAQNATQVSPGFPYALENVRRENYTTQAVATRDAVAVPASYAPLTPTPRDNRHSERWTIRVHTEGDKPTFSVQSENASMECERLVLKLKQNGSIEFIAGKKSVRVRGKDFEAEAESIECQNNDSKLVLSGNVTLTSTKNDCMIKAKKVVWDAGEWHAYGAGSMSIR